MLILRVHLPGIPIDRFFLHICMKFIQVDLLFISFQTFFLHSAACHLLRHASSSSLIISCCHHPPPWIEISAVFNLYDFVAARIASQLSAFYQGVPLTLLILVSVCERRTQNLLKVTN